LDFLGDKNDHSDVPHRRLMMNSQLVRNRRSASATPALTYRIDAGHALRLGRLGGELSVVRGRVWLTRDGDLGDHIVEPAHRVRLGAAENAFVAGLAASGFAALARNAAASARRAQGCISAGDSMASSGALK